MPSDSTGIVGINYLVPRLTVGKVMLEPFVDRSVKTKVTGDGEFKVVSLANTKTELVRLKVLADCFMMSNGSLVEVTGVGRTVLVRADLYSTDWGKSVFATPDRDEKFILLPVDRVEVFE